MIHIRSIHQKKPAKVSHHPKLAPYASINPSNHFWRISTKET